jgi:hypothetical protein
MEGYSRKLFTYLDILGFKNLIKKSESDGIKTIIDVLSTMQRQTQAGWVSVGEDGESKSLTTTRNFSDLVVRVMAIETGKPLFISLMMELKVLSTLQCRLACLKGILIRGGISLGNIFVNDEFIFGPAFVEAYSLGEKLAVFPRVIIDPEVIRSLNKADREQLSFQLLHRGEEGLYFIDYLYATYRDIEFQQEIKVAPPNVLAPSAILSRHKQAVETKLAELSGKDERMRQKAIWLALYHNYVVGRLSKESPSTELESLIIVEEHLH